METCDALVIGGGPAGSSCAWKLRQQGMDVVVMDKAYFPRDKVCAGWITPAVVQALQLDPATYAQGRMLQPITAFRTGLINGCEHEIYYPSTVSYGIRRSEFDDYLLQRSGARLMQGQPLKSMERRGNRWVVNDSITAPMLIGAGGHFCPVANFIGAKPSFSEPVVAAKEIEFEMNPKQRHDCAVWADTPEIYFCRDLKGYGWCFRKGNHLNIGLGREDSRRLSSHLDDFCDFLKQRGKIPYDIPEHFHGHAYQLYGRATRKLYDDGVLLVGDAAGLAYPQSGEGIRPAVESGLLAAATIIEAKSDYRSLHMMAYPEKLRARFGSAPTTGGIIPERLRSAVTEALAETLMGSRLFTRHVVLNRWFLHTNQAGLPAS